MRKSFTALLHWVHCVLLTFPAITVHCFFFSVPSAGPDYEITLSPVIRSSSQASILWAVPQSVRNQSLAYIVITVENQTSIVQMLTSYNTSGSFALSGLGW